MTVSKRARCKIVSKKKELLQNKFTIGIFIIANRNIGADAHVGPPSEKFFLKSGPM